MKYAQQTISALLLLASGCFAILSFGASAYDQDRKELESVLDDLVAWLPGEWDAFPQIHYERTVHMPQEGEHEPWHRSFARIKAPQIGEYVFYGQINLGGRDGPLMSGSQVLYNAEIDEQRGVVLIHGQSPAEPEKYINLQDKPQLWAQVRMRDASDIKCDFVWRRQGAQVVGVLDAPLAERRKNGPGTCSYISARTGKEFVSESEWMLSPEELWLYDINSLGGVQFIGRKDRTHIKLYRARPYTCEVRDSAGMRRINAYDRGFVGSATGAAQQKLEWMLLRGRYPAADGFGLDDQLRLTVSRPDTETPLANTTAAPMAPKIEVRGLGVAVSCKRAPSFGPMSGG